MQDGDWCEKRMMRRFSLELPVKVRAGSGEMVEATAKTRDVSSHGICFYCDAAMEQGSKVEFTLTLPTEVTMTEPLRVRCTGKVVRVEGDGMPGGKFAIAAAIESYEFVSEDEMLNFAMCADESAAM